MRRAVLLYLILVLGPAGALGWFAFRVADGELARRLSEHRAELERDAEGPARRLEVALLEAKSQALSDGAAAVGFARDGRWLGFAPGGDRDGAQPSTEEQRLYEISMRGGESFEFTLRDPARAIDAYAFYLQRIRSGTLRARLRLGVARSAAAAGDRALSYSILRDLSKEESIIDTEEGVPIALAAAKLIGEAAPAIEQLVRDRRELERSVLEHPGLLMSAQAVLDGADLIFGRLRETGDLELRRVKAAVPAVDAPGLLVSLAPGPPVNVAPQSSGELVRPIHLGPEGPVLAQLHVVDPRFEEKRSAAMLQRDVLRGLVVLLVIVTLAGGVALTLFVSRERRLARLRGQLLANVSHELKTPVTSIRLFAEMLAEDGADPEQARRYGRHLSSEGQRLSQLVENLLDVSRFGRKEMELGREPVDLAALLGRIAEGFAFQARQKNVALSIEGLDATEVIADTNAPAIERIVLNLLDNACKYRRADGPSIRLQLEKNCDTARVCVIDNGIGVPRRDQERIFEEFYRVRYDDYAVKGSGLGLAIARRLARKLGGEIKLESREGLGSTFKLEIPLLSRNPASGAIDAGKNDARTNPDR